MEYSGNDFFCDVALKGLTPLEVILENELVLAFNHTRPAYPIHIVVIPKKTHTIVFEVFKRRCACCYRTPVGSQYYCKRC